MECDEVWWEYKLTRSFQQLKFKASAFIIILQHRNCHRSSAESYTSFELADAIDAVHATATIVSERI